MRAKELAGIQAQRQIMHDCPPDLLIRPDVSDAGMFDFKRARHLIEVGRRAALIALETDGWTPGPVG
jgi:predicted acylesterase/phospholipase RssA